MHNRDVIAMLLDDVIAAGNRGWNFVYDMYYLHDSSICEELWDLIDAI